MKLLSVVIPCYNSADYMKNCIESLLPGGEDVELLIVNDGSVDGTAAIADDYANAYPTIVKAIHQENGGHGEAVNAGIAHATGLFFKVVDSDDWVDVRAYLKLLDTLKELVDTKNLVDMVVSNFVYEKEGATYRKVIKYDKIFPEGRIFSWDEMEKFPRGKYMLMHSIIYRTQLLHDCGLKLPKHTFYVDNLYVYTPLPYVKSIYYLNVDFYRYYIGREGQSVQEQTMIKRVDQHIKVNKLLLESVDIYAIENENLRHYMLKHLEIVTVISTFLLIRSGTKENIRKKKELWRYIKAKDAQLYRYLKYGLLGPIVNLPGRPGRMVSVGVYKVSQKLIGFN
ncbi:glycosyltransferase family 2 protein [Bacillus sp. JCM 19034]|uniref:glycosyltransferase family 2 protein n=1 Tax=Bacillus sp. JCM 19034 TaxID=1481928 RepID=UPI0007806268|nr:glycosyltransferase family 2 protein [Bacillus sp. JCM 19034]